MCFVNFQWRTLSQNWLVKTMDFIAGSILAKHTSCMFLLHVHGSHTFTQRKRDGWTFDVICFGRQGIRTRGDRTRS